MLLLAFHKVSMCNGGCFLATSVLEYICGLWLSSLEQSYRRSVKGMLQSLTFNTCSEEDKAAAAVPTAAAARHYITTTNTKDETLRRAAQ